MSQKYQRQQFVWVVTLDICMFVGSKTLQNNTCKNVDEQAFHILLDTDKVGIFWMELSPDPIERFPWPNNKGHVLCVIFKSCKLLWEECVNSISWYGKLSRISFFLGSWMGNMAPFLWDNTDLRIHILYEIWPNMVQDRRYVSSSDVFS